MSNALSRQPQILLPETPGQRTSTNEHWCEHPACKKWGGRGYARGKSQMVWFCFEHCGEAEAKPFSEKLA
jgi:hypothetical protein